MDELPYLEVAEVVVEESGVQMQGFQERQLCWKVLPAD